MEQRRFPGARELISGYFLRHSDDYYQWRIAKLSALRSEQRRAADYDDLAVAYDKLGRHDEAIEVILSKIERWPDYLRYESEANLGTFHIHAGQFEQGLVHIRNAIDINPDAHFGREIYQERLVEYVIESRRQNPQLPLSKDPAYGGRGFATFVFAAREPGNQTRQEAARDAAKGVMGMMRFGHFDSPLLLEALGDLLLFDGNSEDAKMLAARAYLKASYEVEAPALSAAYREKAEQAIEVQEGTSLSNVESELEQEIEQGHQLHHQIQQDEAAWVASGKDLDAEFRHKYQETPSFDVERFDWRRRIPDTRVVNAALGSFVVFLLLVFLVLKQNARRRALSAAVPGSDTP